MKVALIALILVAGAMAHIQLSEIEDLWTTWKAKYGVVYETAAVEGTRLQIFADNYNRIQQWNAAGNTAVLAVNQFADLTNEEFGAIYAGSFAAPEDVVEANTVSFSEIQGVPATWDWRTQGAVTPIKNQEQCGSCWAFATVATVEGLWFINGHSLTSYSEQQIVDCDTTCDGCNGGYPYLAMNYLVKVGLELESDYPYTGKQGSCAYDKSKATQDVDTGSSFVTPKSSTDLQAAIYQQPIAVIVEADQDAFQFYSSGVITTGCGTALDHAITAVGYGTYANEPAFFVKNSW
jgi:C1A family cysteine protease